MAGKGEVALRGFNIQVDDFQIWTYPIAFFVRCTIVPIKEARPTLYSGELASCRPTYWSYKPQELLEFAPD